MVSIPCGARAVLALAVITMARLASAQFTLICDGSLRRDGDVPDETIYATALQFVKNYGRSGLPSGATMELCAPRHMRRHWQVVFDGRATVTLEPALGRVIGYSDSEYFWDLPGGRDSTTFRYQSAEEARTDCTSMLLALTAPAVPAEVEVQFEPEGKQRTAVYAIGKLFEGRVPVSVHVSVGIDPASGKVVSYTGVPSFVVVSRTPRLTAAEAAASASTAYARMRVLGEAGSYDPAVPPTEVYIVPRSMYGLSYDRTEEVLRLRLAWRVRFGHHSVDIDAATGQVLGESLGRKFPN